MTITANSAVTTEDFHTSALTGQPASEARIGPRRPALVAEATAPPTALLLVADGAKRNRLGALLSEEGLRAIGVRDEASALDRLAREPDIDAVIIDADRFGAKIAAVVDTLRRRSASPLAAILMTRDPSFDMLQETARTGPVDILPATPDADALLSATRSAFNWRRSVQRQDSVSNNVFNMLAQIEARLGALSPRGDDAPAAAPAPEQSVPADAAPQPLARRMDQKAIKALIRCHAAQRDILGADLIDGAAWVMLLDLMLMYIERKPLAVTALCMGSGIPVTTALRRLDELIAKRFVEKLADPCDRRRTLVSITPKGVECVSAIIEQIEKEMAFLAPS